MASVLVQASDQRIHPGYEHQQGSEFRLPLEHLRGTRGLSDPDL